LKLRSKKVVLICDICKREYVIYVNENDYTKFMNEETTETPNNLFPHLTPEEIDLMETGICEFCI